MKAFQKNSKVVAFVMALLLLTSFPVFAETASSGDIVGDSDVADLVLNVVVPTTINFALDPLGLATTGDNQISNQSYFFLNQTFAPVKVSLDITAVTSGDAVLVSSPGGLSKDDTSVTDKKLFFGALGATSMTGAALSIYALDPDTTYVELFGSTTGPAADYTDVTSDAATLVKFTPNSNGSTGSAVIAFALAKAVESTTTPDAIDSLAADDKGVAAFQFYAELNTYASWQANDLKVTGTYTLTPLRGATYTDYVANDVISGGLNQLDTTPPAPPAPSTYSITVENDGNGTASADLSTATPGATVTLTATPSSGYQFGSWASTPSSLTITTNTFTMPSENVTVKANFAALTGPYFTEGTAQPSESPANTLTFTGTQIEITASAQPLPFNLNGGTITKIGVGSTAGTNLADFVLTTDYTISNNVITLTASRMATLNAITAGSDRYINIEVGGKTYVIHLHQS